MLKEKEARIETLEAELIGQDARIESLQSQLAEMEGFRRELAEIRELVAGLTANR